MPLIFFNIATLAIIIPILMYFFRDILVMQIPSLTTAAFQFLMYLIFDDLVVYLWHRLLHQNKFLLRRVHSVHHRVRYPTPLEFIYVHPIEWLIAPMGIVVAALVMMAWYGQINIYVLWLYASFRTIVELDIHSNTCALLFKYFPIFVDAEYHSIHHQKAKGNYASMLRYLDKIFHTGIS